MLPALTGIMLGLTGLIFFFCKKKKKSNCSDLFFSQNSLLLFSFSLFHKDALFLLGKGIPNYRHWRIFNYLNLPYNGKPSSMISSFFKKTVPFITQYTTKTIVFILVYMFHFETDCIISGRISLRYQIIRLIARVDRKFCREQAKKHRHTHPTQKLTHQQGA